MRTLRWLVAVAALSPFAVMAPGGQAAVRPDAVLTKGRAAFWSGSARRDYVIDVKQTAWRLRVSWDHPYLRTHVSGELLDPAGKSVASLTGWMSGEAYIRDPRPGRWTLRMYAAPGYSAFRMRAKLENAPVVPKRPRMLLPNLQLAPPYEFTFSSLISGGRGIYTLPRNPATSCTADDVAEQRGVRCLRFSVGPMNVGDGPLRLVFPPMDGLALPGKATQLVTWSDGRVTSRPAGEFEYHKTHAHYHHSGFGKLELLKVTDPARGTLQEAGSGPKQGFCTADVKIAEWHRWAGDFNSAGSSCEDSSNGGAFYDPTKGTTMGLSAGWTDIYIWEQDGNYVEFGLNGDGRYVVRSTADAMGHVLETDESDNTSYAYVQVTGQRITVLERGRGASPWDPEKVVVRDGLPPLAAV